jgi:hypothetical protein
MTAIRKAIADHFGIKEEEVTHSDDLYLDEYIIDDKVLEVVSPGVAISNEQDFGHEVKVDKIRIGMYTWLNGGEYLFRWM